MATGLQKFILNPCLHDYDVHYNRDNPSWTPLSSTAQWNIEKLRLNSPNQINIRKSRELFFEIIKKLEEELSLLKKMLTGDSSNRYEIEIKAKISQLEQEVELYKFKVSTPLD
jgi:hypothetical protein